MQTDIISPVRLQSRAYRRRTIMDKINIAVLPGDNPGREMTCYAAEILEYILQSCQLDYEIRYGEIGAEK